jgi:hypothetical protein
MLQRPMYPSQPAGVLYKPGIPSRAGAQHGH